MQLYLYSSQNLIIKGSNVCSIKAGDIYRLELDNDEILLIYPTYTSGVFLLNRDILSHQQHSQINFHKINDDCILCEIKPTILNENIKQCIIKGANLKLVQNINITYVYFNGVYYGWIQCEIENIQFNKVEVSNQEYGIVEIVGNKKYIILFNNKRIVFCGQYIDNERTKEHIQIYYYLPNVFNIGMLAKYTFQDDNLEIKVVSDRGEERKQISYDFNIIYFLEAIKCGRFKYAHNKLSYELKSIIDIDTLSKYFLGFDQYKYIYDQDVYITI